MAVAAHCSLEKRIALTADRMLHFKARNIGFRAVKALRIVAPQFCSTPFEPISTLDGPGILHMLASVAT